MRRGPFGAMKSVDLRRARIDAAALASVEEVEFVHLRPTELLAVDLRKLRGLSLRHLRSEDLQWLQACPKLEVLEVWQSPQVRSLTGLEHLRKLRWLALWELGPLPSLEPVRSLAPVLEELFLGGGIWKDQILGGDYAPLASLRALRSLTLTNVRGPADLGPILHLPALCELTLATGRFPIAEVARVAASYPFWRKTQPWLRPAEDADGCPRCGSPRWLLLLKGRKKVCCKGCDASRLRRILEEFDRMVEPHIAAGRAG
ncbi:MAG: leucine-rich repeat domain-containing protein [Bryobacterales bacterium]|nr:leucine-rich repeat domain-containing protein [Bryobacterales bacterium]